MSIFLRFGLALVAGLAGSITAFAQVQFPAESPTSSAYDPLVLSTNQTVPKFVDLTIDDAARSREIPIRVWLPARKDPAPVILFSHGLGGSRENNAYLAKHWAGRGYVCVFLQHPGSDEAVWKDVPYGKRMQAMRDAAGANNLLLRVKDVPAVLDELMRRNMKQGDELEKRFDFQHVGMCGHSFGAVTTQAVSGQRMGRQTPFAESRVDAAIMFSPSSPRAGSAEAAFGDVKIPWLLMTGTNDVSPIGGQTVESRLAVYPALPEGSKYELVLDGAEHSAFSERVLPQETQNRNPNHHQAILALSTAFWDAYLRDDADARAWLDGDAARSVLQEKDRWQRK
ncbi:MAG TPA: dienelactone hydrolase [Pirellulaceae bacterium]|jgi:dienelactone hydrolase|nr:dienelactone hydrolase [Pirellulaceae bacterium]